MKIIITDEKIREWERELAEIQQERERLRDRENVLQNRIHAVRYFADEAEGPGVTASEGALARLLYPEDGDSQDDSNADESLPSLIEGILSSHGPLEKIELRNRLEGSGHNMGTRYSYFYTCVKRMEKSGRIVEENGKLRLSEG